MAKITREELDLLPPNVRQQILAQLPPEEVATPMAVDGKVQVALRVPADGLVVKRGKTTLVVFDMTPDEAVLLAGSLIVKSGEARR